MRLIDGFGAAGKRDQSKLNSASHLSTISDFPGCRDLLAYWEALRGGLIVPERTDFDPRGIERTLSSTFVAEQVAPSVVRVRVAGSSLTELLGMDVRGMPITAFFEPDARAVISETCKAMFNGPERVTLDLSSSGGLTRPQLSAKLLMLPMSDVHGDITRLVGCLETTGRVGRLPRRFGISRTESKTLHGVMPSPVVAAKTKVFEQNTPQADKMAFAEKPQPAFQSRRAALQRDARAQQEVLSSKGLRLVVDNT